MTKKGVSHQIGFVKGAVIVASLAASPLGARMAAIDDVQAGRVTATSVVLTNQENNTSLLNLPSAISSSSMPPVARSQSSR